MVHEEEAIGLMGEQPSDLFTVTVYTDTNSGLYSEDHSKDSKPLMYSAPH